MCVILFTAVEIISILRQSSESEISCTELETRRDMGSAQERQGRGWRTRADRRKTGYGDLCRYFQRSLGDNVDSEEAQDVNTTLHKCSCLSVITCRLLAA